MRAEDRKPSKRVFPLLQNLDLDSVTFSQVQSVGEPISIEDMNEQEMLDLIIVNLARLCVSGEWTGLLEAGGSSGNVTATTPFPTGASSEYWNVGTASPYGGGTVAGGGYQTDMIAWPFIAPNSGVILEMALAINAGVTNTVSICIYTDDDGLPDELMGYGDFDISGSGTVVQNSFSEDITTVKGTQYWYCIKSDSTNQPNLKGVNSDLMPSIGNESTSSLATSGREMGLNTEIAYDDAIPATLTPGNFSYFSGGNRLVLGIQY